MITPTLLNLFKTSLKSLYDIDPFVVDYTLLSARFQAKMAASRSTEILHHAQRAVRAHFTPQPLGQYA